MIATWLTVIVRLQIFFRDVVKDVFSKSMKCGKKLVVVKVRILLNALKTSNYPSIFMSS